MLATNKWASANKWMWTDDNEKAADGRGLYTCTSMPQVYLSPADSRVKRHSTRLVLGGELPVSLVSMLTSITAHIWIAQDDGSLSLDQADLAQYRIMSVIVIFNIHVMSPIKGLQLDYSPDTSNCMRQKNTWVKIQMVVTNVTCATSILAPRQTKFNWRSGSPDLDYSKQHYGQLSSEG